MLRVIVRGVARPEDVKAAAAAGADGVAFVVESKEDPANLDISEVVETARLAPPLVAVVLETTTKEESRIRRAIGSAHPHAVVIPHDLDPMILADLQVSFPEVKWFARLSPTEYEPFHDAADALVFAADDKESAAKVREATRSRVLVDGVTPENAEAVVRTVRPYGVVTAKADAESLKAVVAAARAASGGA